MENNQVDINLSTDIKTDNLVPLNITLMSRDINNNSFLLKFKSNGSDVQLNNSFTVEILSVFPSSKIEILTQATVYGNTAVWEFDTKYITRNEVVYNYVYVKKDGAPIISADANAFTFNVGLSKIDGNAGKTAETYDRNYEKVLHEFEVAINLTKDEWAQMAVDARNFVDETRNFVDEIKGVTVDQFVETKMGEELANLEVNYATRLVDLETNDNALTAQLAQTDYKLRPKQLKPLIAFTIDDGVIQDLDIFDVAQQYNIPFTTAIISSRVGTNGYLSQQQIKTMENAGWEVTSHSKNHVALPDLSDEQLELEVRDSKQSLLEMGFNVKSICLPYGRTSEQVRNVAAKHYRSMRVSGLANNGVINYPPIDTFGINSVTLGDSLGIDNSIDPESGLMVDTLPYWKYLVDKAIASNGLLIFISHAEPLKLRLEELKQLFVYVQSLEIETVTLDEALDTFQNQVDTQKMKIGADGTVSGEYGKIRQAPYNTILGNTNIKDIAREMVTYNTVTENAGQNSGLPKGTGGTSLVVNPDNRPDRSFQLLKSQGIDGGLFLKEFDRDGIASGYRQLDTVYVHPANSLKSNHTLSDLKRGRLNYCAIYTSGASGYPRDEAGLLIADDLVEGYFNETYFTISGNTYKRNKIGDGWEVVLTISRFPLNAHTAGSSINGYPFGISYAQISVGGASTFPEGKGGMLETHRITANGYNFQYYHIYNEPKTYKRVVMNDGTWSNFVLF